MIGFKVFGFNATGSIVKVLRICGVLALCVLLLSGCKAQDGETEGAVASTGITESSEVTESAASTETPLPGRIIENEVNAENISEFITLGEYIGIEYDHISLDVSDEEIEEWISLHLSHVLDISEVPELTDDLVSEHLGYETVDEYRAFVREQLEMDKIFEAENSIRHHVWNTIVSNATVHKYPESEVEFKTEQAMLEFTYYASVYDIDLSDFIAQISGFSLEDFIELEITPNAVYDVKQDLVVRAIAVQEGFAVADSEFDEAVKRFSEEYGYESEEAFIALHGEESVRIVLLSEKVIELVMSSAVER